MRIIYPHPMQFPNKKAHSIQIINTCWALASEGSEVILVISKLDKKSVKESLNFYGLAEHPNLKIKGTTRKKGRKSFNLLVFREALRYRKDKNTVLFFRDKKLARIFIILKWFLKIPCIIEEDAPASSYRNLSEKLSRNNERLSLMERFQYGYRLSRHRNLQSFLYRNADGIICQTKGIKQAIYEDFAPVAPVEVISCASKLMNRDFEYKADNILYLGHLYPQKGVDILVSALKYLPDRKLVIVGGNKKEDIARIKKLSSTLGIEKQVVFAGCVPHADISKYFENIAVAVIPLTDSVGQRLFTSPMKLFEYMSAKIPIVASDFPSMREILEDRKTAVLVEPENPKALAEGIEKVLTDREFARKIVEQAYEKVKDFTWKNRAEKIIRFIEHIIKNDYKY